MRFFKYLLNGIIDSLLAISGGNTKCGLYQVIISDCFLLFLICLFFVFDYFFLEEMNINHVFSAIFSFIAVIILIALLILIFTVFEIL